MQIHVHLFLPLDVAILAQHHNLMLAAFLDWHACAVDHCTDQEALGVSRDLEEDCALGLDHRDSRVSHDLSLPQPTHPCKHCGSHAARTNQDQSYDLLMALATACQTPGIIYSTKIDPGEIRIRLDLGHDRLYLSAESAEILEANLHNALELVMARFYCIGGS